MSTKQDIIDYVMHTPANTNRAVLEALLDDLATELPASTAEDAGKVLTVGSTGAAEWAEPSGGGGAGDSPVFALILNENFEDSQFESTTTWGELNNAILAKKIIIVVIVNASTDTNIQVMYTFFGDSGISTSTENGKWVIVGTFTFDKTFYDVVGYEDNANDLIVIPMLSD